MTRAECEQFIGEKIKEIWEVYLKYNPDGEYLTMCVLNDTIMANNSGYRDGLDADTPINLHVELNKEEENDD